MAQQHPLFRAGALLVFLAGSAPAHSSDDAPPTQDRVGLSRASEPLSIAVPADGKLGDLLKRSARGSDGFEIVPRSSLPDAVIGVTSFDKATWRQLGNIDFVILSAETGGQLRLSLYEVSRGNEAVLTRSYAASNPQAAADGFMAAVRNHLAKTTTTSP